MQMNMRCNTHRPRRIPSRRERSGVFFRVQNERACDVVGLEGLKDRPEFHMTRLSSSESCVLKNIFAQTVSDFVGFKNCVNRF